MALKLPDFIKSITIPERIRKILPSQRAFGFTWIILLCMYFMFTRFMKKPKPKKEKLPTDSEIRE